MLSAAMPRPASAMPTAESIAAGQQNSPFHSPAACSERPTAPSVQPASQASSPAPRPAPTQASASQDSSAVDLTSPDVKPPNVRPITVDLTEEVCNPFSINKSDMNDLVLCATLLQLKQSVTLSVVGTHHPGQQTRHTKSCRTSRGFSNMCNLRVTT